MVLRELDENGNTSVTNMIEYPAAEVLSKALPWRWDAEPPAIVLEHYPSLCGIDRGRRAAGQPIYDLVRFSSWRPQVVWQAGIQRIKLGVPEWSSLPLPEVAALLGEAEVNG